MFIPPKKFFAISCDARPNAMVMNPSDVQRGFSGRPIASAKNNTVRMLTSMRRKFLERFLGRGEEEKSQQEKEEVEEKKTYSNDSVLS